MYNISGNTKFKSMTLLALLMGTALSPSLALSSKPATSVPPPSPQKLLPQETIERKLPDSITKTRLSFSSIVKKVSPAVVSIYTSQENLPVSHPLFDDDFMQFFFGRGHDHLKSNHPSSNLHSRTRSMGSGVIVDRQGIVVTCAHVVQNAKKIKVKLLDNREFTAKVKILDRNLDLAILMIEDGGKVDLPFVPLGRSSNLEVGDLVLAIGNPFGVGQSVSNGIISALARNVNGRILVQTDTPINPGNSGGALVDTTGELIAIPNAILSKTGGFHGIGFGIPSSVLKPLIVAAQTNQKVQHPWDGLLLQTLSPDHAESFGMKDGRGALVVRLQDGSPAGKAGLKAGDVILGVNGTSIESAEDYVIKMQDVDIGSAVNLNLFTKDGEKSVQFILGSPPLIPAPNETVLSGDHLLTGVKVANLSPGLAVEHGFPMDRQGVVVIDSPHSQKEEAISNLTGMIFGPISVGVIPGDIILSVHDTPINSVEDLKKITAKSFSDLQILRGREKIQLSVRH